MKLLSRQILSYGIGLVISKLQVFILFLIIPQFLLPEEYGIFEAAAALTFLVSLLSTLNLDTAVGSYYNDQRDPNIKRVLVSTGLWTNVLASAIAVCGLIQIAPYISSWLFRTEELSTFVVLAGTGAILNSILTTQQSYLRYRFMLFEHNVVQISGSVLVFVLTVGLIALADMGVYGLVYGNIGGTLIVLFLACYFNRHEILTKPRWSMARTLLKTGMMLIPFTVASWALSYIDRSVLMMYRSAEEVGLYGVAVRFAQAVLLLFSPFQSAWLPYALVSWNRDNASELFNRVLSLFLMLAGLSVLALSAIFQFIILWSLPETYHESAHYVPILAFGHLLATLYYFPLVSLMVQKRTWVASLAFVLGAISNIFLNMLFVPSHGIGAAAWATLAGYAVVLIVVAVLAQQRMSWHYPYARIVAVIGLISVLSVIASVLPFNHPGQALIVGAISATSYVLAVWLAGFPGWAEAKAMLRSRLRVRS